MTTIYICEVKYWDGHGTDQKKKKKKKKCKWVKIYNYGSNSIFAFTPHEKITNELLLNLSNQSFSFFFKFYFIFSIFGTWRFCVHFSKNSSLWIIIWVHWMSSIVISVIQYLWIINNMNNYHILKYIFDYDLTHNKFLSNNEFLRAKATSCFWYNIKCNYCFTI